MFLWLKSENPCFRDLKSKLQKTEVLKKWILDKLLRFGHNLGRSETQTAPVTLARSVPNHEIDAGKRLPRRFPEITKTPLPKWNLKMGPLSAVQLLVLQSGLVS